MSETKDVPQYISLHEQLREQQVGKHQKTIKSNQEMTYTDLVNAIKHLLDKVHSIDCYIRQQKTHRGCVHDAEWERKKENEIRQKFLSVTSLDHNKLYEKAIQIEHDNLEADDTEVPST